MSASCAGMLRTSSAPTHVAGEKSQVSQAPTHSTELLLTDAFTRYGQAPLGPPPLLGIDLGPYDGAAFLRG